LPAVCRNADVLVAAVGRSKMIPGSWIKPGAVVIDVGMNRDESGKLCGDVEFESAVPPATSTDVVMSPVPAHCETFRVRSNDALPSKQPDSSKQSMSEVEQLVSSRSTAPLRAARDETRTHRLRCTGRPPLQRSSCVSRERTGLGTPQR